MYPTYSKAAHDAIKLPPLCDRYGGFSEPVKTNHPGKPFHHISHCSRQHFRTVLPMWPASLVVILWKIDLNPSRLGCNVSAKIWRNQTCWKGSFWIRGGKALLNEVSLCFPIVLTPMNVMVGDCITQVNVFFSSKDHHVVFFFFVSAFIAPFNRNEPFQWHLWEGGGPRIEKRPCGRERAKVWFAVHFGLEGCGWNNKEDEIA